MYVQLTFRIHCSVHSDVSFCDDLTSELTHNIRNMDSFRDKCKCTRKGHLKGSFLEMGTIKLIDFPVLCIISVSVYIFLHVPCNIGYTMKEPIFICTCSFWKDTIVFQTCLLSVESDLCHKSAYRSQTFLTK